MKNRSQIALITISLYFFFSCNNADHQNKSPETGGLTFYFEHVENGTPLVFDEMKYTSAPGNQYEVKEIQYFLSDFTLHNSNGKDFVIEQDKFAHYIDTNLPETSTWKVAEAIPAGEYKSISMTFGIKGEKNKPYMFTDTPESNMLWPTNLGGDEGGYHYMKLNGFWINKEGQREPFNFHLGVGQERDSENNITGFIQNWVEIELPSSSFVLKEDEQKAITIEMDVDQWWENPNNYDHNTYGGKIMQNQEAMSMGAENAKSVFKVSKISTLEEDL
jgi:hypothetical protein